MATANIKAVITAEDRASGTISNFGMSFGKLAGAMAVGQIAAEAFLAVVEKIGKEVITAGVTTAASMETAKMGFITLLGSADEADKTIARIKKEAARTPFEVAGLTKAVQLISSVTKDGNKAIDIILNVGEALAAMGKGQAELDRIIVNLQQIAAVGKASMLDIKQFAFAGIPIFDMLQKETGLAGDALDQFISDGKVSFDLLTKMFDKANDSGGRFFGAFKNQAGTFDQLMSNMRDTFNQTAADIITQTGLFDLLKQAMQKVGDWITANKDGIVAFFKGMGDALGWAYINIFKPFGDWLGQVFPPIIQKFQEAWVAVQPLLAVLWNTVQTMLMPALKELWRVLEPYAPYLGTALAATLGLIIMGFIQFAAVLAGVIWVITKVIQGFIAFNDWTIRTATAVRTYLINAFVEFYNWNVRVANGINGVINALLRLIGLGKIQLPSFSQIPGRAIGGPVTSNMPYIVGERGPEVFIPNSSGRIIPNNQISKVGNKGTGVTTPSNTTINISPQIGVFAGTPQEMRNLSEKILDALKDIADSKNMTVQELLV